LKKKSNVINLTDFGPAESRQHGTIVYEERAADEGRALRARRCSTLEVLEKGGSITPGMRAAGELFFAHFSGAGLGGKYATINMFRIAGSGQNFSDARHHHLIEVREALDSLGRGLGASAVWAVAGENYTVKDWANTRIVPLRQPVALGILMAALDRLAEHWGL